MDRVVCSRYIRGEGAADLDRAIALAPESSRVRLIVADAYTYGNVADPQRAFAEASFELAGGLNTPRFHAIFARVYLALGNQLSAAAEFRTHIELVTTQLVQVAPFTAGATLTLPLVLGRSCEIPVLPWSGGALDPDEQPRFS